MSSTVIDPKTPATKPHGTTDDQIKEMESEGQAQQPPPVAPAEIESPKAADLQGAPGPRRSEFDKTMSDQDIDTAGTDADKD